MSLDRRDFLLTAGVALASLGAPATHPFRGVAPSMYGLIGKMAAAPGQRDALVAILLDAIDSMPGCLSYVVAVDPADADTIWITEVWDSKESHAASLTLPAVRAAIAKARPLIASFGQGTITTPVGGHGLATGR